MININSIKKIIKICNESNVVPIIFGGIGYFLRTFDFEEANISKKKYDREFKDVDIIVSSSDLEKLKNKFIDLGYELDLSCINGYVGFIKKGPKRPYTIEDSSGTELGPKRFSFVDDGLNFDFDALDDYVNRGPHQSVNVDEIKFKIASVDVLVSSLNRKLKNGWYKDNGDKIKVNRRLYYLHKM